MDVLLEHWAHPRRTSTTTSSPPPVHPEPRDSESEADPFMTNRGRGHRTQLTQAGVHRRRGRRQGLPGLDRCGATTTTRPQKRKQTHYEDVTVEVQPDPRHYLAQGWLYGFSDGRGGYPLDWTALKAWGVGPGRPGALPGVGRQGLRLARPRLARVPRPQRGVGADALPQQRQRRAADQPEHRDRSRDQGLRAVEPELGDLRGAQRRRLDARRARARALPLRERPAAGTHQHAQQRDLGEQHAPDPLRPGPRALQPHAQRGDRGLRRCRPRGDLEQRPGLAGRTPGRRTAHRDRRLGGGDLRRQHRLRAVDRGAVPEPAGAAGGTGQR